MPTRQVVGSPPTLMVLIFGQCITDDQFRTRVLSAQTVASFPSIYGYKLKAGNAEDKEVFNAWKNAKPFNDDLKQAFSMIHSTLCPSESCPCDACFDTNFVSPKRGGTRKVVSTRSKKATKKRK